MVYRNRCDKYVPAGMSSSFPQFAELGRGRLGQIKMGLADELNRDPALWWWADVSDDGSHWAAFQGHRVQVDIGFHTENWREVNEWKGRDEIRATGEWTLSLARQQCWQGQIGGDPLAALRGIPRIVGQLLEHPAIDWMSTVSAASQLLGRRVYYERVPAYISSVSPLLQGCVMVKPVGMDVFPKAVYQSDDPDDELDDPCERQEIKDSLLSPDFWWWRKKAVGDEDPTKGRTFDPAADGGKS